MDGLSKVSPKKKLNLSYDFKRRECRRTKLVARNLHFYSNLYTKECRKHAEKYFQMASSEWGVYFAFDRRGTGRSKRIYINV